MKRIQRVNLIDGPILPSLLSFAFPILLSNIFQQLYNTSDVMIVGRFLGQKSLAAVGATSAIFDLIVGFAVGVGNGMGIVIARSYGAKNENKYPLFPLYSEKSTFSCAKEQGFCLGSEAVSGFDQPRTNHGPHVFDCLYRNSHLTIGHQQAWYDHH